MAFGLCSTVCLLSARGVVVVVPVVPCCVTNCGRQLVSDLLILVLVPRFRETKSKKYEKSTKK